MKLLDSSVLVAFLNERDSLHEGALKLDLKDSVFNELVLAEVANVLQKRVKDKQKVKNSVTELLQQTPVVLLSIDNLKQAMQLFFEYYPRISFTDAALAAQAKNLNAQVLTFDDNLSKII
ncbi:TPA: PIN domain-containing protein [Candidatus Micrarchaeota archaeon]|nr:PIN domain-containing protein [Candidatus Micrarchaeota archaeon]